MAGSCEHGSEPSGAVKCREFLDYLGPVSLPRRNLLHGVSSEIILCSFYEASSSEDYEKRNMMYRKAIMLFVSNCNLEK